MITHGILAHIYVVFLRAPDSRPAKDLMIGKGKDWRDDTHLDLNHGFARTDLFFFMPLFLLGSVAMLLGQAWGYAFFGAAGACSVYINIALRTVEKKHVYPALGALRY